MIRAMFFVLSCLLGLAALAPIAPAAVRVQDGLGRTVELARPAQRVISYYGAFNETLLAMGAGDRIVARTRADRHVPELAALPAVGTHLRPNVELTLASRPDLVLQLGGRTTSLAPVERIQGAGIPVAVFNPSTIKEYFRMVHTLGQLLDMEQRADALVNALQARLDAVARRLPAAQAPGGADRNRPTVFFEVRSPNLLAAGAKSIVTDVIRLAGGENCVKTSKKLVRIGEEAVLGLDPDVYIVQSGPMNPAPADLDERPLFTALRAVRSGRWTVVEEHLFSRPGPRVIEAVERLADILSAATLSPATQRPGITALPSDTPPVDSAIRHLAP